MPKFMMKLMNPIMKAMLKSPIHGRVSGEIMIITFTGRKSGKQFSTPVGYVREGTQVYMFTHGEWWRNFIGGAMVNMLIQRKEYTGTAQPVQDAEGIKAVAMKLNAAYGEKRSKQFGFWVADLNASAEQIARELHGTHFVVITLTP